MLIMFDLLTLFSHVLSAAPICAPTRSQIQAPSEVAKYFDRISIVGNSERRIASDFGRENGNISAAEVEKRFAASGDLYCEGSFAQAQVVLKNDLIVTSAHELYGVNCEKNHTPSKCRFALKENGKLKMYEISKLEAGGSKCPNDSGITTHDDWVVLRLKTPVSSSIKPYAVGTPPCAKGIDPADLVHVAKSTDFPSPMHSYINTPRHYGNCQSFDYNCEAGPKNREMLTDCDATRGSSGGGMFTGGATPLLVAITQGAHLECPEDTVDQTGGYQKACWDTTATPMEDVFKAELLRIAGMSDAKPTARTKAINLGPSGTTTPQDR